MIKRYLPFLMIVAAIFSSCSSEDNNVIDADIEGVNESLLQSYKLSRDASGKYTIDYKLAKNAQANLVKDESTNTNNLHTFETKHAVSNRSVSNSTDLDLDNNQINIDVYQNGEQRKSITVEDENIVLAKGEVNTNFLQTYSVESFGDGQFVLDFKVREGINVNFEYNADENIYEVHLKEGLSNVRNYTKIYNKSDHLPLKIDFVNYIKTDLEVKTDNSYGERAELAYVARRMPRYGTDL
ncbi:hypothetical protein [Tenacibaculum jejuense]|uniref:Probable lipoprotein n=1 Tax=Tenacibaculum jejuense TaxID=584609 RepID=A0A238UDI4_9FLAO|nr:hypothetical protein [Tenacibaculum jejuense]SNR17263.1 Probable lipoprotein precursor [Tenacibaculum jejuense]